MKKTLLSTLLLFVALLPASGLITAGPANDTAVQAYVFSMGFESYMDDNSGPDHQATASLTLGSSGASVVTQMTVAITDTTFVSAGSCELVLDDQGQNTFGTSGASSRAFTTFQLTLSESATLSLSGSVTPAVGGGHLSLTVLLEGSPFYSINYSTPGTFAQSQVLEPGNYTVISQTDTVRTIGPGGFAQSSTSWNYLAEVTPVPEPSVWALLVLGAFLFAGSRFRKMRAAS